MLMFCPTCANLLGVEEGPACLRFSCATCPYVHNVTRRVVNKTYPKLKEVDDVLGGSAAWENVDSTDETCPVCSHPRAYFMQIQTRKLLPLCVQRKCSSLSKAVVEQMNRKADEGHQKVFSLESFSSVETAAAAAAAHLSRGEVVAVPTDTVYGLAALALDTAAVNRLYTIKGRRANKPVAVAVACAADAADLADVSTLPLGLLSQLLPGPVTVALRRDGGRKDNPELNPGAPLVGIRVPDDNFIRAICRRLAQPVALTSANESSAPSALQVSEFAPLWPRLAAVFDIGPLPGDSPGARLGSTVVDLSEPGYYRIIRGGCALKNTRAILEQFGLMCADFEAKDAL